MDYGLIESSTGSTIQNTINATINAVVSELKKQNLIKTNEQTAYQKTESLLYNYPGFKEVINDRMDQIKLIKEDGLIKRSKSIVIFSKNSYYEPTNDFHKAEDMIEKIQQTINETQKHIDRIDEALRYIQDDQYYQIIPLKYFDKLTRDEIAKLLHCDAITVSRNKNRLINQLQIRLFSDEVMSEIFGLK